MNREIKFRGLDDKRWRIGFLVEILGKTSICIDVGHFNVKPETVGQFTGLKDKKGVEIYEGDIVSDHLGIGTVEHSETYAAFRIVYGNGHAKWFYDFNLRGERESIEVIGNIHENPELLEVSV